MRRLALLATVVLAVLTGGPGVHAQETAYTALLREALAEVRQARASQGAARDAATNRALDALKSAASESGMQPPPYLGHIEDALTSRPPDLERAEGYLGSLLTALAQESATRPAPAEEASLREVLRDPRFAPEDPPGWLERLGQRIGEWLDKLLPDASGGAAAARTGLSIAQWLLVLACVGLVAIAAFLIVRAALRRGPGNVASSDDGRAAPQTSSAALAAAAAHARNGEYRAAVRAQFLAVLLHLHEQGRLRYDRSLTNREHLSRIARGTPLAEDLRPVVRVFDDVWYGNLPIGPEEYEGFRRHADSLMGGAA